MTIKKNSIRTQRQYKTEFKNTIPELALPLTSQGTLGKRFNF